MKKLAFALLLSILIPLTSSPSQGLPLLLPVWADEPMDGPSLFRYDLALNRSYQIGSEWGKTSVDRSRLARESAVFKRTALATAKIGGGTAFYLGKFHGQHVMATNHHVMPKEQTCFRHATEFPLLGKNFRCRKFYGEWTDVDLALYSIEVPTKDEGILRGLGKNFASDKDLYTGQLLLTIGFGVANNPGRRLMANQDSDCKVFSGRGEYRFMADPDEFNPGPYRAWSFSNGCEVSHGDSGSAMVDRVTGAVVGIIWTGRIPKDAKVQDSRYLATMLASQSEEIWQHLSYAVPAPKIREHLDYILRTQKGLDAETRSVLGAMLAQ